MASRILASVAARNEGVILLLGRLAIGVLYVPSGFGKLTGIHGPGLNGFAQYLAAKGAPGPAIAWAVVAAAVEFFASAAIVLGFQTRLAALLLAAFTVGAAFIGHQFWAVRADQSRSALATPPAAPPRSSARSRRATRRWDGSPAAPGRRPRSRGGSRLPAGRALCARLRAGRRTSRCR